MAVTFTRNELGFGGHTWYLEWTSNTAPDGPFYVYIDGLLSETTYSPFRTFSLDDDEHIQIEILDSLSTTPTFSYPGRLVLSWDAPAKETISYLVQQYVDSAWTDITTVTPVLNQTYFEYETAILDDVTTHQFRVIPIGVNNEQGTSRDFTVLMVRIPDQPDVAITYSQITGLATIADA